VTSEFEWVGVVMAKSPEGDAVAQVLGRLDGVEVKENPTFWDIRAKQRMSISYDDVSEELGAPIDGYQLQIEMSTHYGRMVHTDEALLLFADFTEAMESVQ
jgi:propane monooxygenase coupling protein